MTRSEPVVLVTAYHSQPYWNLPGTERDTLEAVFPEAAWIHVNPEEEGDIPGLEEVQVVFGWHLPPPVFFRATRLQWVHSLATGVRRLLYPGLLESSVVVTSSRGVHAPFLAEQVMAWILAHARRLYRFRQAHERGLWAQESTLKEDPPETLLGKTALLVGFGAAGEELARRLRAFGVKILAVRRHPERGGENADEVARPDRVDLLLPRAQIVVNLLPNTEETRLFFNRERLERIAPGAFFANVGRGSTVDETALAELLAAGRFWGGLDVFAEEPLPPESPLWRAPSVQISPHLAGVGHPLLWKRLTTLFADNLRRYITGRPLRNVVDKKAGY